MKKFLVLLFAIYNYSYCINLDELVTDLYKPKKFLFYYSEDNSSSTKIPLYLFRNGEYVYFRHLNYYQRFKFYKINNDVFFLVATGNSLLNKFSYGILRSYNEQTALLWLKEKNSEIGQTMHIVRTTNNDYKLEGDSKLDLIVKCKEKSYSVEKLLNDDKFYTHSPFIDYVIDKQTKALSYDPGYSDLWNFKEKNLNGSYESSLYFWGLISQFSSIKPSLFYIYCPPEHRLCLLGGRNEHFALILTGIQDHNKVSLIIDPSLDIQDYLIDWVEKINPDKNALTCLVKKYAEGDEV